MKQFRSPTGKDIRVTDLSGNIAIISSELRELPEILWGAAYALGAVSSDMKVSSMEDYIKEKKEEQLSKEAKDREDIKNILRGLYDSPKDILDNTGKISHRKATMYIGKALKKDYIEAIWNEIVLEKEEV